MILWVDTFNGYFHPEIAMAAVRVLEEAGRQVIVPARPLCCGRPLYDFGLLGKAKQLLEDTLEALRPEIERGTPVVGLEPSCVSVFRDEMRQLLPNDQDAERLRARTYLLSEFLEEIGFRPPHLDGRAIVHGHCHHKSVLGLDDEKAQLDALGLDYRLLDSGCCGMAGAFGFERAHYDVAQKVGEHELLPTVRAAGDDTMLVTDGFSCREQIRQNTGRRALHLAEVIERAVHPRPEPAREPAVARPWVPAHVPLVLMTLAVMVSLLLVWLR